MTVQQEDLHDDYLEDKSSKSFISNLNKFISQYNTVVASIAGISLVLMMSLIVFNAIIRLFTSPVPGTVEIVGWLAAITGIFALGYAQLYKAHVYIDLLIIKLPGLLYKIIHTLMNIISIVFFSLAAWNLVMYGLSLSRQGVLSETLEIPFYPIVLLCSLGLLGLLLAIVRETIIVWREN